MYSCDFRLAKSLNTHINVLFNTIHVLLQDSFIKSCRKKVQNITEDDLYVDGQFMSEQDMIDDNVKESLVSIISSVSIFTPWLLHEANIVYELKSLHKYELPTDGLRLFGWLGEVRNQWTKPVLQTFSKFQLQAQDTYQGNQSCLWRTERLGSVTLAELSGNAEGVSRLLWIPFQTLLLPTPAMSLLFASGEINMKSTSNSIGWRLRLLEGSCHFDALTKWNLNPKTKIRTLQGMVCLWNQLLLSVLR